MNSLPTGPQDQTGSSPVFQLLMVATAACAACYARFTLGPLQEAMRVDLGLGDNQMALLQGAAVAVPMALCAIPLGLIVDRYSRVPLLIACSVISLAVTLLAAFTSDLTMLFVSRGLIGLCLTATLVAAYSVVGDLYAPAQRGRAAMMVTMGEVAAAPAAFALGGVLLAVAGSDAAQWRWALLWMCAPLVPCALLLLGLREPRRTDVVNKDPPLREVWPKLWRYRGVVVPLLLARIMVWLADGGVMVWGVPSFSRRFDLPADRIGSIMATALTISGILGPLLGGPLADLCQRRGGPRLTITCLCILAVMSAPTALFTIMPNPALAGVLLTTFLTLHFTIATMAMALAIIVIPGELRGLYIALCVTVGAFFSIGVAPMVVSGLSETLGGMAMIGKALAIVCGLTSIVGAVVFLYGRRYFPVVSRLDGRSLLQGTAPN